jgi:methylglutaconyl-CoA hydratase
MLNALKSEVDKIYKEAEAGSVRAMILTSGDAQSFCAGADLKERATFTQKE